MSQATTPSSRVTTARTHDITGIDDNTSPCSRVAIHETTVTLATIEAGMNPHPVFPQWNPMDIYPNLYWGSMVRKPCQKPFRMVYLENDYLRLECNIDIGGRVWSLLDKVSDRHLMNHASGVWSYNGGFGKSYTCGGMEINYPLAHSPTTRLPREYRVDHRDDGAASITIGELERTGRTRWSVTYTLAPGRACLDMDVRLYNRTPIETRYMYWANCGAPLNEHTQLLFPETAALMHGWETRRFSWPMWNGKDMSYYKNVIEPLGLYMIEAQTEHFGYYDHDAGVGLAHWGDLADLPGKKMWTWGCDSFGRRAHITRHPDNLAYGEIQSGRPVVQEHLHVLPPESETQWHECWYPIRNMGQLHATGPDVALSVDSSTQNDKSRRIQVAVQGVQQNHQARVCLVDNNRTVCEQPVTLTPAKPAVCDIELPAGRDGDDVSAMEIVVRDDDGHILVRSAIEQPQVHDACYEMVPAAEEHDNGTAEAEYMHACRLLRDWMYHPEVRTHLENSLRHDPGYSPALGQRALLDLADGLFDKAAEGFIAALARNDDDLKWWYYLGVARHYVGDIANAQRAYERACRDDYEPRSRVRLAECALRAGDPHRAVRHLQRVCQQAGQLTRPRGLLAAGLRRLGRTDDARREILAARQIDPMDPFLQFEAIRVDDNDHALADLTKQLHNYEPPLLEAAFDYGNAGLYDDALFVLERIPEPGPLTLFYRACMEHMDGKIKDAAASLERACSADPVGQCAWRLEMIAVLQWAAQQRPDDPAPAMHLGNLLMARHRTDEAVALWQQSARKGQSCYLPYAALGFYCEQCDKDPAAAIKWLEQAESRCPDDYYVIEARARLYASKGDHQAVIDYLLDRNAAVNSSPHLAYHLLNAYLATGQYNKFDEFVPSCDYHDNWQLPGPQSLWNKRYFQQAMQLFAAEQYQQAADLLEHMSPVPNKLAFAEPKTRELSLQECFHLGRCYERLNNLKKARDCWNRVVANTFFRSWEPAIRYQFWRGRYFQALAWRKLGNPAQADALLDGMETAARSDTEIPASARRDLLNLVRQAQDANEDKWDPAAADAVSIDTSVEW